MRTNFETEYILTMNILIEMNNWGIETYRKKLEKKTIANHLACFSTKLIRFSEKKAIETKRDVNQIFL